MLKVFAALFVVLGLIGIFALMLRWVQSKSHKLKNLQPIFNQRQLLLKKPIKVDDKHQIMEIQYGNKIHTILCGPTNDILLSSDNISHNTMSTDKPKILTNDTPEFQQFT